MPGLIDKLFPSKGPIVKEVDDLTVTSPRLVDVLLGRAKPEKTFSTRPPTKENQDPVSIAASIHMERPKKKEADVNEFVPETPFDETIEGVFGKQASNAKRVLRHRTEGGEIKGENTGFLTGPEVDIPNEDGSIDRGLFRINSNTFFDFMLRKEELLRKNGITNYNDMFDPELNTKMAKLIFDEQGWDAWFAAPKDLLTKAR